MRKQKGEAATALPLVSEPFTAELNLPPDVTAVAASAAAATAAAVVQKAIPQTPTISAPVRPQEGGTVSAV